MRILHISDTHFKKSVKRNDRTVVSSIKKNYPSHLIILTGDVVNDGQGDQYRTATNLLDPFRERLLVCPGNHDYRWEGNFPEEKCVDRYRTYTGYLTPTEHRVTKKNGVAFIEIDSAFETLPFEFASGKVGERQRQWLTDKLDELAGSFEFASGEEGERQRQWLTDKLNELAGSFEFASGKVGEKQQQWLTDKLDEFAGSFEHASGKVGQRQQQWLTDKLNEFAGSFEFASGKVGERQRQWLTDKLKLKELSDLKKVVYLHHHPFIHLNRTMVLRDAKEFMDVCRGKVDVLLFGHKHVANVWRDGKSGDPTKKDVPKSRDKSKKQIPLICACGKTTGDGSAWDIDTDTLEAKAVNLLAAPI
jgi:3',5'-cyclic AMP phosphodiesterase CpdA